MTHAPLLQHLAWDTQFFGVPIAKTVPRALQPAEVDLVLQQCEQAGVQCLYCELDPHELATVAHVQELGFRFVEFRMVLQHDLCLAAARDVQPGLTIEIDDCPRESDLADLAEIAAAIAPMSRFAVDHRFGADASRKLYARWLQTCLEDSTVKVILARLESKAVGLVTLRPSGSAMHLTLLGVAPEVRGQGIGGCLVHAAISMAAAAHASRLDVITQGRNAGAVRTYERAGFTLAAGSYYFHKWWE